MEKTLTVDEALVWETLKSNKYLNLNVINTEYNLSCRIDKFWIGGRLDAFMNEGDNYFILDYKTGNIPKNAEQDFQTIVYLLCADKFLKHKQIDYKSIQFVYLGLKNSTEISILLDDKLKEQYEQKIFDICEKIDLAIKFYRFFRRLEIIARIVKL